MICLPCMALMQTCLMCWSVGALPWDRKGKRVQLIHTSIKRPVFNSQLPDLKEPRSWIYRTSCCGGTESLMAEPGSVCHSPEGPGCRAGQWHPVLPVRLGGQAVLWGLQFQEAPGYLRALSNQALQDSPPETTQHTVKSCPNTRNGSAYC